MVAADLRLSPGCRRQDLPLWHHLVCGDPERVHKERISQSGRMLSETQVAEDDWEDYLIFRAG